MNLDKLLYQLFSAQIPPTHGFVTSKLGFYSILTLFVPFIHEQMLFFKVLQTFSQCHITFTRNHFSPEETMMKAKLDYDLMVMTLLH